MNIVWDRQVNFRRGQSSSWLSVGFDWKKSFFNVMLICIVKCHANSCFRFFFSL